MATHKLTGEGIAESIQADIDVFRGRLPERYALAWRGYLDALRDWDILDSAAYHRLLELVPVGSTPGAVSMPCLACQPSDPPAGVNPATAVEACITADLDRFQGALPTPYVLAWGGYLAGLLDRDVVDWASYRTLSDLLPPIGPPNPVETIFSGRIYADELEPALERDIERFDGRLPDQHAIAWRSYLAGLADYGALSPIAYESLIARLPAVELPTTTAPYHPDLISGPRFRGRGTEAEIQRHIESTLNGGPAASSGRLGLAWRAYVLGLLRWQVIDFDTYDRLTGHLPPGDVPDAVLNNALGRE